MRILYVGSQGPQATSTWRALAMRRLGHDVTALDIDPFLAGASRVANWLRIRTLMGPAVARINAAVLAAASTRLFDLVWFDKPIWIRPATVRALRAAGATVVDYMPDNPFGPRGDPGWRLYRAALAEYDAHVFVNPAGMTACRAAAPAPVLLMPQSFEPTVHFPPPAGWDETDRNVDVAFIGTPYDQRADFIRALWRDHGIAVAVWGEPVMWRRRFSAGEMARFHQGRAVYAREYRHALWRSRICLGFVTRANLDTFAHRWFEIAGCRGFLLAERTADGLRSFAEGQEAAFFEGVDECAAAIRRYLPNVVAREAIAHAGHARAVASGYDNDSRLRVAFAELARALPDKPGLTR